MGMERMTLTINLFTPTFAHSEFSTAYQTTDAVRYVREQMEFDGLTMFTDGLINSPLVDVVHSPSKIGWLREPRCLQPEVYEQALGNLHKFDFIMTYSQELLDHPSGKFRLCPYSGVWVPQREWGLREKTKNISMLFGTKRATRGHQIRWEIWDKLGDEYGIDYYGAKGTRVNYGWQTKLQVLRDYKYSIVIETCREKNLFTEILLDCFALGTIPLFWGAPNIGEYFEGMGILSFENVYQLESLIKEIDEHTYDYLKIFAKENLRRVRDFRITEEWMISHGVFDEVLA